MRGVVGEILGSYSFGNQIHQVLAEWQDEDCRARPITGLAAVLLSIERIDR